MLNKYFLLLSPYSFAYMDFKKKIILTVKNRIPRDKYPFTFLSQLFTINLSTKQTKKYMHLCIAY